MQYKVPQNIDIEDRVVSFLTLRQFLVFLVGALLVLFVWGTTKSFLPGAILFLIGLSVFGVAGIFAFYKYNDKPLELFLSTVIFSYFLTPRKRAWKKETYDPNKVFWIKESTPKGPADMHKANLKEIKSEFEALAKLVDSGGFVGIQRRETIETELVDTIATSESGKAGLDKLISEVAEKSPAQKREPKISELATVAPREIKTEQITLKDANIVLEKIRQKEAEEDAAISVATVSNFHKGASYEEA